MVSNKVSKAVRLAIAFGAASTAAFSANTFAADEDGAEKVERIEVTGSRIKRVDLEGAQQVVTISKADIVATGLVSVGDILQKLPSAGSALNTATNNGGDGSTRISLRNLGANRVLVMVNGRRWVPSGGSVDLNSIPISVIERIDVLKDGASSIYGSDAMVGVVNVITKKEFEGAEYSVRYGETAEGDGERTTADFTIGSSSDKGNVVINLSYTQQEDVMAGDREFSKVPVYGTGNTRGSSGTPQGRFSVFDPDGNYTNVTIKDSFDPKSGKLDIANDTIPFTNDTRYNYAPVNFLDTPQERTSFFVSANYEITEDMLFDTQVFYTKRQSSRLLAPTPLFIGPWAGGLEAVEPTVIHKDNPYNPFGYDVFGEDVPAAGFIGRRMLEGGGRLYEDDNTTFAFNSGISSEFELADKTFFWDVNYNFGENRNNMTTQGLFNRTRIKTALGDPALCAADPGCVPLNLFGGQGPNGECSITQEMLAYIGSTQQTQSGNKLINYTANLSGEVFELPAGMVGFATGYEYRKREGFNQPDYLVTTGQSTGNFSLPTRGNYSENSYYLELAIPLLEGLAFAEKVDLVLATRKTSYENSANVKADNTSSSAQLTYRVNDDLLIRSSISEGFRVPTINNLFGGAGESFNTITDPCNGGEAANPDLPGCKGVDASYTQPNSQIRTLTVSTPELQPETSLSKSVGFVFSPSFIENFSVSLDYYDVEIEKSIIRFGGSTIMNTCAETGTILCDFIQRDSLGYVTDFLRPMTNSGGTYTKGFDWSMAYSLETSFGDFRVSNSGTYVDEYVDVAEDFATGETEEIGRVSEQFGNFGFPRIKSNFNLDWSYEDFTVALKSRYIGRMEEACTDSPSTGPNSLTALGLCSLPVEDSPRDSRNKLGGTTYHDIQATYFFDFHGQASISLGVNNLTDKVAPISYQSTNSIDTSNHDYLGRNYYIRFSHKF